MKKVIDIEKERDKYDVFRNVFDMNDKSQDDTLTNYLKMQELRMYSDLSNFEFLKTVRLANYLKGINSSLIKNREKNSYIIEYYYSELLDQMCILADELELRNSLEVANLYSYLLWNGYLSKNKQNMSRVKTKSIDGLYFSSIMDGVGDCINHSDLLKDFLNRYGYNASSVINLADKKTISTYKPNIEQQKAKKGIDLYTHIMNPVIRKAGNHVFTLIEENNKFYIYDSSNLNILSIKNPYIAEIINGKGIYIMHPFLSCIFNMERNNSYDAISNLFYIDDIISPYNKKDFIAITEENIENFKRNISSFEYFYDDVRSDIINIAELTGKIKMKKRG